MALDLEMNQPSNKIFQIGIAIGDTEKKEVIHRGSWYVKIDEPLSEKIIKLCHVDLDSYNQIGFSSLYEVYNDLKTIHTIYQCYKNPITWGGGDSYLLMKQLGLTPEDPMWVFGRRWLDIKTVAQVYNDANRLSIRGGLAKTLTRYGLKFIGTKHDAGDDAYNTLLMYFHFLTQLRK